MLRKWSQASGWYGVRALHALALRTALSSMILSPASRTFVHMRSSSIGTSLWPLPVVAELETLGIDQVTFSVSAAVSFGSLVPEEFRCALVDGVTEPAKTKGAG